MGQYKIDISFSFQIGICVTYEKRSSFVISLPFISIYFGLLNDAKGIRIFGKGK